MTNKNKKIVAVFERLEDGRKVKDYMVINEECQNTAWAMGARNFWLDPSDFDLSKYNHGDYLF